MRNALKVYSNILQLRTATFEWLKHSPAAVPFALTLFFVVTLLAGCGQWLALPGQIERPTLAEQVDTVEEITDSMIESAVPALNDAFQALSEENLTIRPLEGSTLLSSNGVRTLLARLALSPEQVRAYTLQMGLSPEQVASLRANVEAFPDQVDQVLEATRQELETLQPPLGTRFSRILTTAGRWLGTPFQIMAAYLPFVLLALLVARALGGKATVSQHLVASAVAVAPAVLLFFVLPGNLTVTFTETVSYALVVLGRTLAALAFVWAVAILIKSLSIAHEFSKWRSAGTLILTYGLVSIVLPFLAIYVLRYLALG